MARFIKVEVRIANEDFSDYDDYTRTSITMSDFNYIGTKLINCDNIDAICYYGGCNFIKFILKSLDSLYNEIHNTVIYEYYDDYIARDRRIEQLNKILCEG